MAGVLACELGNSEKLSHFLGECQDMGISVLGPDVNESGENFTPLDGDEGKLGEIRFGLSAVKGVGDVAGKSIVLERQANGSFINFGDFVERVDGKAANKRVLECLIKTGAFDALHNNRAALLADLDRAMGEAQLRRKDREAGQANLFDMMGEEGGTESGSQAIEISEDIPEMDDLEKLKLEKELLGFFLSGHPVDTLIGLAQELDTASYDDIMATQDRRSFRLCGVLADIEKRYTKKDGSPWARFTLMAKEKDYSLPMFTEAFEKFGNLLQDGGLVVAEGVASNKDGEIRINVITLQSVDQAISQLIEEITWLLDSSNPQTPLFLQKLFKESERGVGKSTIGLAFAESADHEGLVVELDPRFRLSLNLEKLRNYRSENCVRGMRVKIAEPTPPPEPRFKKRFS